MPKRLRQVCPIKRNETHEEPREDLNKRRPKPPLLNYLNHLASHLDEVVEEITGLKQPSLPESK